MAEQSMNRKDNFLPKAFAGRVLESQNLSVDII